MKKAFIIICTTIFILIKYACVFATPVLLDNVDISPHTPFATPKVDAVLLREQAANDSIQTLLNDDKENDSNSFIMFSQLSVYKHNIIDRLQDYDFTPESTTSTPVNEPATMLLLGSGIASLAALRRRRNKSKK